MAAKGTVELLKNAVVFNPKAKHTATVSQSSWKHRINYAIPLYFQVIFFHGLGDTG